MESSNGENSYLSIICHDIERSYKWIYVCVLTVPFLVCAIIYIKLALGHRSGFDVEQLRIAVIFFIVTGTLIVLSIRIKGFRYHLLLDKTNGKFSYHKDTLISAVQIQGDIHQIKDVFVIETSILSDSLINTKKMLYKIGIRYAFQDIIVYVSLNHDHAYSMGTTLSSFIEVPLCQD